MRSSTDLRRGAGAVAIALALLLGFAGTWGAAPRTAVVRPAVVLSLGIDSDHYREMLADPSCTSRCRALRDGLVDSVRALLRGAYPFLRWDEVPDAPDTIEILWADRPPLGLTRSDLRFRIRSPEADVRSDSMTLPFEEYADFSDRDPGQWTPDTLRRQWLARLPRALASRDLLVKVIGRIPIKAPVKFDTLGRALVSLTSREIGAAESSRPAFVVRAKVADPATNSDDVGDLKLGACKTALTGPGYSCVVEKLDYIAEHDIRDTSLLAILKRAAIVPKGVHLVEFTPRSVSSRYDAPVPPPVP